MSLPWEAIVAAVIGIGSLFSTIAYLTLWAYRNLWIPTKDDQRMLHSVYARQRGNDDGIPLDVDVTSIEDELDKGSNRFGDLEESINVMADNQWRMIQAIEEQTGHNIDAQDPEVRDSSRWRAD